MFFRPAKLALDLICRVLKNKTRPTYAQDPAYVLQDGCAMSRPARVHGFPYVGIYRYFLTFCTQHRAEIFRDPTTVRRTLMEFRRTAAIERFAILAYCLMPDHVHPLVEGLCQSSDLRRFTRMAKQRAGSVHARHTDSRLWQEGYYERVLRPEDDARMVARYIVENPVRSGLARTSVEYPYVGSDRWSVEELIDSIR